MIVGTFYKRQGLITVPFVGFQANVLEEIKKDLKKQRIPFVIQGINELYLIIQLRNSIIERKQEKAYEILNKKSIDLVEPEIPVRRTKKNLNKLLSQPLEQSTDSTPK